MKSIAAIYKRGAFHPIEAVSLPDHTRVRVELDPIPEPAGAKARTRADLLRFRATVQWPEDPAVWQRRHRDEDWA